MQNHFNTTAYFVKIPIFSYRCAFNLPDHYFRKMLTKLVSDASIHIQISDSHNDEGSPADHREHRRLR